MPNQPLLPAADEQSVMARPETAIAVAEPIAPEPPTGALTDLRHSAMSIPLGQLTAALAEYAEKRMTFRRWLLSQMVAGVHYGVPPGCEPKSQPDPRQWRHKPSLYKAGAEFVADLMGLRDVYEADETAWKMLGGEAGLIVIRCRLLSRSTGEEVGQGIGAGRIGQKSADANKASKDAQKRAKVAAALNSYGLSDLFTQDIEDGTDPPHPNPDADPKAPQTQPRGQRQTAVSRDDLAPIAAAWKDQHPDKEGEEARSAYKHWVRWVTGREFNVGQTSEWTPADVAKCRAALKME